MNALKICDAVDWQMQLSVMKSEDALVVKTCVARYTCKEGINEKVKYLFHRVCNAIKSVFGQSDWQKAERVISNHIYSYVPSFCRELVKDKSQAQVHYVAGKTLKFLVWENKYELEVPSYAKTLIEGQLKLVNLAVSQLALNVLQRANLFGLSLFVSLNKIKINPVMQLLAAGISKMNFVQQQNFSLSLINNIAARILQLPMPQTNPQLQSASS